MSFDTANHTDAGETAAIGLAGAINADVLLIDEKLGRAAARRAGLSVAGVLGEHTNTSSAGILFI